jgi:hypothetical protein
MCKCSQVASIAKQERVVSQYFYNDKNKSLFRDEPGRQAILLIETTK